MTGNSSFPEKELVRKAIQGDSQALGRLLMQYQKRCYGWLRGRMANEEDRQDVLQNAFLKATQGIGTFDAARPFFPWLMTILHNEMVGKKSSKVMRVTIPGTAQDPGWDTCIRTVQEALELGRLVRIAPDASGPSLSKDAAEDLLNTFVAELSPWTELSRPMFLERGRGYCMDLTGQPPNRRKETQRKVAGKFPEEEMFDPVDDDPTGYVFRSLVLDSRLLEVLCRCGGRSWQILAFGFVKLLRFKPLEMAADYSALALRVIEHDFEEMLASRSGVSAFEFAGEMAPLRRKVEGAAGEELLEQHYSGTPAATISYWCDKVKNRVFAALHGNDTPDEE